LTSRLARNALMLGNLVTGTAVLAPAGMLNELSAGLGVTVQEAGWLITFGAVILCFGSPLVAWATSRVDRRLLMTGALAIVAVGHFASALAPNYALLLLFRLLLLAVLAVYTPQAASVIGLIVDEKERPTAISYVFLGWSLAIAFGLPLVTFLASELGWRSAYAVIAAIAAAAAVLNAIGLPRGLLSPPVSFASWLEIGRSRRILLLLLITVLMVSGGFQVFAYLGPLLSGLANASPQTIGLTFAGVGVLSVAGNVVASRLVGDYGAFRISLVLFALMFAGSIVWVLGAGILPFMIAGIALSGTGFAAFNSMQQARLAAAAPRLAGASIALNTSSIYVGQALGSAIGGALLVRDLALAVGYVAAAITGVTLVLLWLTREPRGSVRLP
jgi:predicted MFS family arabinose efflux permease